MASQSYLAVDIGASSGRVLAGALVADRLHLLELHRFANGGVNVSGRLHWDFLALWQNLLNGMRKVAHKSLGRIISVGVDTWGVDFGLLGEQDVLLGNPYHYRDSHTQGIFDSAFRVMGRDQIFAETGIQFMELNSLYQLFAMQRNRSPLLENARSMMLMPDLFHWLLSGEKGCEQTNASTTQIFSPVTRDWSKKVIDKFGFNDSLFQPIVEPGTTLGGLQPSVAAETGLEGVKVVLPATHDTASAFVAVPAEPGSNEKPDWCVISSGTWSLMGVEVAQPVLTPRAAELNFTNECGIAGTTRLLKNIAGLWLVQECRRIWSLEGKDYDWSQLVEMAEKAEPLRSFIDPDAPLLGAPENMVDAITDLCESSGQPLPRNEGEIIRCALESLALRYATVLDNLEELLDHSHSNHSYHWRRIAKQVALSNDR